jgi:hypothetical protein
MHIKACDSGSQIQLCFISFCGFSQLTIGSLYASALVDHKATHTMS